MYAISPYVDSCHFITVPARPDASPDAYVTSCQHSMMRVMNEGKECIGGIYWGRYIYRDLYAFLTPEILAIDQKKMQEYLSSDTLALYRHVLEGYTCKKRPCPFRKRGTPACNGRAVDGFTE